jgi:hypothetical protein
MRERGRYQLQLMKTRNSSGVGQKIDLGFDVDTLRIIDCDEDDEENGGNHGGGASSGASSIVSNLKRTNTAKELDNPSDGVNAPKIRAETDSTKLRQFLNNLPGDE